ncbi:hypothetical protein HD553DRAFT_345395 [Filobasidium floriforme]|uniref:uncharacterized protein n=1 Tax=Filobasidium floriforme TaxID=5210 RepID=UPI001E8CBE2B|nr:uncharacterized protein HD553DRAFT_345395 [Filobasidium floriforme]KAH8079632.1 hypothetical protein HD553DRAFT_345395 [Filobasidium floriforme]
MITSADIKHAAIRFFSENLDCSALDPAEVWEFLDNEKRRDPKMLDNRALGLKTALETIKKQLGPSNIETVGADEFRYHVVQVWLARAFCYFASQVATKLENSQTLTQPYCEIFDSAKDLVWGRNSALLDFCLDVHYIAKQPLFQEQGWVCPEEDLEDLAKALKTLRSYTWEKFEKTFEIPHDSGSTYSFDVDGVSGMSNWDIETAIGLLSAEWSKRQSTSERGNPSETSMSMQGTEADGTKFYDDTTTELNTSSESGKK